MGRICELAFRGVSTGSRSLDRCILFGIDAVDNSEYIYDIDYVPTAEEHLSRQDPGEQCRIYRPRLMVTISDAEFERDGEGIMECTGEFGSQRFSRTSRKGRPSSAIECHVSQYDHILCLNCCS